MKNIVYFVVLVVFFFVIGCENPTEPNKPPTCIIKYPSSNVIIDNGDYIEIYVEAEDEDGEIDEVRFYINGIGVSSDSEFPYTYKWRFEPGEYVIKAVAIDNEGAKGIDSILVYVCLHTEYDGIPSGYYTDHFIDYFDDNKNGWPISNSDSVTSEIVNGAYKMDNKNDEYAYIFYLDCLQGINDSDNFEIEVKLGVSDKGLYEDYWFAFVWGLDTVNVRYNEALFYYEYNFIYTNNLLIFNYDGTNYNIWYDQEDLFSIMNDVGYYNMLTIRKFNNTYHFFLNEYYLGEHDYIPLYGDICGFVVGEHSCLYVDYIKIYKIKQPGRDLSKTLYKYSSNYSKFKTISKDMLK